MKLYKQWIVAALPFIFLMLAGSAFAQEAEAASETVATGPAGVELGVLLAGVGVIIAVGAYMAIKTKTGKENE
jgi:hypothetical protein